MSDLISRQAAIDHWRLIIDATSLDSSYNMGFVDGLEFCINHLSTMPAVQPEIIRCKDCKYWLHEHQCIELSEFGTIETLPNEFCNRAERRTDE